MAHPSWGDDWTVNLRVWVERCGCAILGKGRLELLEAIERWRSIRAAAQQLNMSYRRAWLLVQGINEAAGTPLVVAATGGAGGGGAVLTPLGQEAVRIFREVQGELQHTAATLLPKLVRRFDAPQLHVAAAVSLEDVLGQLLGDYALRQPTVGVRTIFGASDELAEHVLGGAAVDLFLTADEQHLTRLHAAGLLKRRSRCVLAENTLAIIVPAQSLLRLRRVDDLAGPSVGRVAIARATVPLGAYTRSFLMEHHLWEPLLSRAALMDNSRAVLTAVRAGQVDAGLVYGSDAAHATECRLLLRIPRPKQPIRYVAAVLSRTRHPAEAAALCDFLQSKPAAERWRQCGFLPVRKE